MLMSSPQNSNLVNEQEKEVTPQFPPSFFCTLINHLFGTCLLPLIAEADGDSCGDSASTLVLQGGFLFPQVAMG